MNYYEHHLGDYMRDTAHLSMLEDAAYRRLLDAYYVREKPLPLDPKECAKLARATSKPERDAVAYVLREFFERREDGYHQRRADVEIARFQDKSAKARASIEKRWERVRVENERNTNVSDPNIRTYNKGNTPPARPQTPDTRHQSQVGSTEASTEGYESARASDPDHGAMPVGQNLVVRACTLMRQAGIPTARMNPSHAELIAGVREGALPEQYRDTAIEAINAGKENPFAWVIATVRKRNAQAHRELASGGRPPPAAKSRTRAAIEKLDRMISHAEQPATETGLDPERIGSRNAEAALPAPARPAAR